MGRWTAKFALILVCCFFVTVSMTSAGVDAMIVNIYGGYDGCDYYMHTNFFELNPGETAEIPITLSKCMYLAHGLIYYAYVDEMVNYATKKHKLNLYVKDAKTDAVIDPEDFGGCYVSGREVGCWMDVAPGPGPDIILVAHNYGRKSQLVRLQSSVNVFSPCK